MSHSAADDFFRADAERLGYLGPGGPGLAQYYRDHGMDVPGRGYRGRAHEQEVPMDPDIVVSIIDQNAVNGPNRHRSNVNGTYPVSWSDRRSTNGRHSGSGARAIADDE